MQFRTVEGETVDIEIDEVDRVVVVNQYTVIYYDKNTRKAKLEMTPEQFYAQLEQSQSSADAEDPL